MLTKFLVAVILTAGVLAYVDWDSLRQIWTLIDKKIEQQIEGKSYLSQQALQQFDCEEETFQFLAVYYRSGKMGEGEAVHFITGASKWHRVPPYTPAHLFQMKACNRLIMRKRMPQLRAIIATRCRSCRHACSSRSSVSSSARKPQPETHTPPLSPSCHWVTITDTSSVSSSFILNAVNCQRGG